MRSVLAALAFRAETAEVERAQLLLLVVLQRTMWAERAEASVVVWTRRALGLWVDVEV